MSRSPRERHRSHSHVGMWRSFSAADPNQAWNTQSIADESTNCFDWVGRPLSPTPFNVDSYKGLPYLDGKAVSEYNIDAYVGSEYKQTLLWQGPTTFNAVDLPAEPPGWYLSTVAGTNPSRPVVTIPTLAQDLIELPKQIFETGKLFRKPKSLLNSREAANQFLCVKFGWLPLIDDLRQLLDMQASILKRTKELQSLYSGKGLRRRIKFSDDTKSEVVPIILSFYGPNNQVTAQLAHKRNQRVWATIRWYPTTPPPYHPSDERYNKLASRIAYGLTPEGMAKGLWDVIPWTWLLGWFTNIGKYTLAYSNTVPASHTQACLMRQTTYTCEPGLLKFEGVKDLGLSYTGTQIRTVKDRLVSGSLTPGFNMPFLDMSRLSVLGALFVQRLPR